MKAKVKKESPTTRNSYILSERFYEQYVLIRNRLLSVFDEQLALEKKLTIVQQIFFVLFLLAIFIKRKEIKRSIPTQLGEFFKSSTPEKFVAQVKQYALALQYPLANKKMAATEPQVILPCFDSEIFTEINQFSGNVTFSSEMITTLLQFIEKNTTESFNISIDFFSIMYENDLTILGIPKTKQKIDVALNERRTKGAFYTPAAITRYMCEKVLFSYLATKLKVDIQSYDDVRRLPAAEKQRAWKYLLEIKILDPAAGTGEFLVMMAKILTTISTILLKTLEANEDAKNQTKMIMLNNLFGVDLLPNAITVTKLRLLLWYVLDNNQSDVTQRKMPNLEKTLVCGNSLIGLISSSKNNADLENAIGHLTQLNHYQKKEKILLTDYLATNPFHWSATFSEIITKGGFDIVIGNPPYIERKKLRKKTEKMIFSREYKSAFKLYDIAVLFLERSLYLLKEKGFLSFIITNKFISTDYGLKIRELLLKETKIHTLIDVSYIDVFRKIASFPIIITLQKMAEAKTTKNHNHKVRIIPKVTNQEDLLTEKAESYKLEQKEFEQLPQKLFVITDNFTIIKKMQTIKNKSIPLGKLGAFHYRLFGFTHWEKSLQFLANEQQSEKDLRFIGTANIDQYAVNYRKKLSQAKKIIQNKYLHYDESVAKNWKVFTEPKILIKEIAKNITAAYDPGAFANATGIYMFIPRDNSLTKPLTLILNSKVMDKYFAALYGSTHMTGGYLRYNGSYLKELPILLPEIEEQYQAMKTIAEIIVYLTYTKHAFEQNESEVKKTIDFFKDLADYLTAELYFEDITPTKLFKLITKNIPPNSITDDFLLSVIGNKNEIGKDRINGKLLDIQKMHQQIEQTKDYRVYKQEFLEQKLMKEILE